MKTTTSTCETASSRRTKAIGSPLRVIVVRTLATIPPMVTTSPSLRDESSASGRSTLRRSWSRTSASGWLVRYRPSVSFSSASSSRRSNSASSSCGWWRPDGAPASTGSPRSKIDPWPRCSSACAFWPAASAVSNATSIARRDAPVESRPPHLIRLSSTRLLSTCASTRSHMSQTEVNGPPSSRARHDRAHRALPHALDRGQAEADLPVDHHEVGARGVDVGRQHLDAHVRALGDVERHLVLGLHDGRDQRRHVRLGVVRLQVGRAVRDERVAGGVRLVERVVGRALVVVPQAAGHARSRCRSRRSPRGTSSRATPSASGSSCRSPCADRRPRRARSPRDPWRSASTAPGTP